MITILYIEINVTCIFLLGLILYKMFVNHNTTGNRPYFCYVVLNALFLCLFDTFWALIESGIVDLSSHINFVVNCLYLFQAGHLGYSWYLFSEATLDRPSFHNRIKRYISAVPIFILLILCVSSYWTGNIFYIDETNSYTRGDLYFLQPLISYSYIIYSAIKALILGRMQTNHIKHLECRALASFLILPLLAGIIQLFNQKIPTLCVGISLSLLTVFMTFQEHQISLDSLTGLNNRFRLHRYLESRLQNLNGRQNLYLLMLDIDSFKKINDTYGHVEGDEALKMIADVLRKSCGDRNCFIARYGGDEFVVVYECNSEQDVLNIKQNIFDKLNQQNSESGKEYNLSVSIGYSVFTQQTKGSRELVEQADEQLYKIKEAKKSG